eukprot:TRINITY_DN136853_c1_g1_i1.p1 TRINITY_DN136853_c1_g1~~TRINITY_DN136853_c1_g1_i1.p1  ORF type:complete len:299 (-),score=11.71 TRINITY_DN136853_c1_g1_i1:66-887(-)
MNIIYLHTLQMSVPSGDHLKQDLRGICFLTYQEIASHFTLGQHPPVYETSTSANYRQHYVQTEKNPHSAALIGQTHFSLGGDKANSYQTMYEATMKPYDLSKTNVNPAPNKNFVASFHIGLNNQPFHLSEAQIMYRKPSEEAYKVDKDLKANIRFIKGSHFELGADRKVGGTHFVTLNEQTYQPKQGEQAKLSTGVQMDLRKSHFSVGNMPEPIISTNQVEFRDKSKEVPKEKMATKALRETHFALGDGKSDFVSMKMLHYRDPKLNQPLFII